MGASKYDNLKIGKIAQTHLKDALESGSVSDVEIKKMMESKGKQGDEKNHYSRLTFGLNFPLLAKNRSDFYDGKVYRYYSTPITIRGTQYYLCSQWFEGSRIKLTAWLEGFGGAAKSETTKSSKKAKPKTAKPKAAKLTAATNVAAASIAVTPVDSIQLFLDYFSNKNLDKDSFYKFGIESTEFAGIDYAKKQWNHIKEMLLNKQELRIRGYGRDAKQTEMYFALYRFLFDHHNIKKDSSNNTEPTRIIQKATGYIKNSQKKRNILNFTVAHIFGCTKNPLLFNAAWNICYKPTILDPLTGHEAQGDWPIEYQRIFHNHVYRLFGELIMDYNKFIVEQNIQEKVEEYLPTLGAPYEKRTIDDFSASVRSEWAAIELP